VDGKYEKFPGVSVDLYRVKGVAPTYTNGLIGGVFENLTMNWWVFRRATLRIDYDVLFNEPYDFSNIVAVSQCFLLEEAEMFKNWIDGIYPEEETEIIKVEQPMGAIEPYPLDYDMENKRGSFWSNPAEWLYDLAVCYYIDTNNVKVRAIQ
jgi:hypothetical protein